MPRKVLTVLLGSLIGLTFAQGETGGEAPQWTGTITMYAQTYTPNMPDAESPLSALREVADEYEAEHPGVTIEFVEEEIPDTNNTIRVKAAAGELWDVFWAHWNALNGTLPQGVAVDLSPYFAEPNPYAPDHGTWAEAMNPTVIAETADPSGANYNINGDFVATAFYYNQDLFEEAGITEVPRTWEELLSVANQLQEAGIPVQVGVPLHSWWQRHFLSDFYAADYDALAATDGSTGFSALDEACAIHEGVLSTEDPRFMAWWPLFKELTDTWVEDYIALDPSQNFQAQQDFVAGNAAMIYEGSWMPNIVRDANVEFTLESFSFPPLGQEASEYSTGRDTSNAVGGPNAGYQFAVSTPRANRSMEEPGKLETVIDWLRYLGTPEVSERIVNEKGDFIPTFAGTEAAPGSETLVAQAGLSLRTVSVGNTSPTLSEELQRTFGLYLSDNLGLEAAQTQVQAALDRAVEDYARTNDVNLDEACQ